MVMDRMDRWRPSALRARRPLRALDEVERYMDEVLSGWPFRTWRRLPAEELSWAPPVEMYERDDKFVVRTELPGVKIDEIDISISGDVLTIKGERRVTQEVKEEEYHRAELAYGSFSRSITMPAEVDAKGIEATYEDGILEVNVPKAKGAKPSKIKIKTKGA
jgi:HSP20 family protein